MNETKKTAAERLDMIDLAIEAIMVGGQSYKLGSRSLTRANLSELRAMRDQLAAEVAGDCGDGIPGCYVAEFLPR